MLLGHVLLVFLLFRVFVHETLKKVLVDKS
jgi:hypothetical protein